jgi:hypothetical protein
MVSRLFNTMKVGDITEPVHFPDGRWIIFKLTNRQLESKPLALEDPGVKEQIKQGLIETRQTILQGALIRSAVSEAQVVNTLAADMVKDPNMLGNQSVAPGTAGTPAATTATTPAATPNAAASPAATSAPAATPAAGANTAATPRPAATTGATPKK